jgi:hypothetical protein
VIARRGTTHLYSRAIGRGMGWDPPEEIVMPTSLSRRAVGRLGLGLSVAAPTGGCSLANLFVPKAELWSRWEPHDPASTASVDHAAWTGFLHRYVVPGVDGVNRVAYHRVAASDRSALRDYIEALAQVRPTRLNRDEQFAYWVNLYNAVTAETVLAHYPVQSIFDIKISPGLLAPGPWGKKLVTVEGEPLSLDDIESRILRPIWRDARVHYAVNCASIGCPNLRAEAWAAQVLDQQLDAAGRAYANHPRGARTAGGRLIVSSIYEWFQGDFGGSEGAVLRHLRGLAAPALAESLVRRDGYDDHAYDWALNDAG